MPPKDLNEMYYNYLDSMSYLISQALIKSSIFDINNQKSFASFMNFSKEKHVLKTGQKTDNQIKPQSNTLKNVIC